MWHHPIASEKLTLIDDEITALTGGIKAWEGGVVAAHAAKRYVFQNNTGGFRIHIQIKGSFDIIA